MLSDFVQLARHPMLSIERLYCAIWFFRFSYIHNLYPDFREEAPWQWCFQQSGSHLLGYKIIMDDMIQFIFDQEDAAHQLLYEKAMITTHQVLKHWEVPDVLELVNKNLMCSCWSWMHGKLVEAKNANSLICIECGRTPNDQMGSMFDIDASSMGNERHWVIRQYKYDKMRDWLTCRRLEDEIMAFDHPLDVNLKDLKIAFSFDLMLVAQFDVSDAPFLERDFGVSTLSNFDPDEFDNFEMSDAAFDPFGLPLPLLDAMS